MKVLVATDSYKGSLTSLEAGEAIRKGILAAHPDAEVCVMPLADGGEGTSFAIAHALGAREKTVTVTSPVWGKKVAATYAICADTAVIEMSAAAGITLVEGEEKNPLHTTTYGVGEMIADAIASGCRKFILGIGGSATNDCGIGMLQALGYSFTDANGKEVQSGACGVRDICAVHTENRLKALDECTFTVACDVTNPLCGKTGCSFVFARQKGASEQEIIKMDGWIARFADLVKETLGIDCAAASGSGAAGGLGYALLAFLRADMQSGADLVLSLSRMEEKLQWADIAVTGEGKMDGQSVFGKAPIIFAKLAKKQGKKVLAFCGCLGDGAEACNAYVDAYFSVMREAIPLEKALESGYAAANVTALAEQVFRLL